MTLKVQLLATAIVAPVSEIVFPPVRARVPPQVEDVLLTTDMPACNVSVNVTPVSGSVFAAGFVIVKARVEVPFSAIVVGVNDFAIDGGASTARFVEAVKPVPPSTELIVPVVLL